jgi:hypothetical protein
MTNPVSPGEMSELADDRAMTPLMRRALYNQVDGQEPSPAVWPAIRRCVSAGRRRPSVLRWTTLSTAVIAVVFALTLSYSYQDLDRATLTTPDTVLHPLVLDPGTVEPLAEEGKARQTPTRLLPDPVGSDPQWRPSGNAGVDIGAINFMPETPLRKESAPNKPQPATQGSPVFLRFTGGAQVQPL